MKKTLLFLAAGALCFVACQPKQEADVIGKPNVTVQDGRFTPEVMWSLGVMSEYAVSPDGSQVLYTLRYTDMEQNKNNAELYRIPVAGGEAQRLTTTAQSEFSPAWVDESTIMFCRGNQIISMDLPTKRETVVAGSKDETACVATPLSSMETVSDRRASESPVRRSRTVERRFVWAPAASRVSVTRHQAPEESS